MNDQMDMLSPDPAPYGGVPPYERESDTSRAAAFSKIPTAPTNRTEVYRFIRRHGSHGATDDEIERGLALRHQTASARRRELVLGGLVEDSGLRRPTSSGRKAAVWILVTP